MIAETFDPTVTPMPETNDRFTYLRCALRKAIQTKNISACEKLLVEATKEYPLELEGMICHAELIVNNFYESIQSNS